MSWRPPASEGTTLSRWTEPETRASARPATPNTSAVESGSASSA